MICLIDCNLTSNSGHSIKIFLKAHSRIPGGGSYKNIKSAPII